ncbi:MULTISPECIES: CobW family GTP-binding protein [Streptomyces]|uniref:Putative metal chaperone YciC n=1 Tax=Streptomyces chartreusis NRRL 3882 TaxID=1079985 RepID=A0A2N9B9T1_STRCX|nr:GTP-binding protein [Streptomyces chartreusis]MYS93850.1 cobalamin biosynthesis protein CobW [Streptomyces sp. SID5464]SOR80085.1 putative metal chaperone YciC [Streptomyces chartreusis NRRL 3882]
MAAPPGLSVVIVGGLHADARKAAVARLLADVPGSVALHHDLATAAAGTVVRTVRDATGVLDAGEAPLVNDCACCALREDLVPELERLADAGRTPLAVVELWDSVEPKAMAEVVTAGGLTVTGVITAVDPALVLPYLGNGDDLADGGLAAAATDQRTVADTFARQLEYAPVLAIAESPEADDEDRELLAQLHPTARQVPIGHGDLAGAPAPGAFARDTADGLTVPPPRRRPLPPLAEAALAGFDVESAAAAQHPACALLPAEADAHGVSTLVWQQRRPFHPERLYAALEDLTCAAARSRGRFWLADKPDTLFHWDAAGGALCVESAGPWLASLPDAAWEMVPPVRRAAAALDWHPEHGDRGQHLVFTSPGLDRDGLERLLESCLLTDAEYAAGRDAWQRLPHAFDTLLEV